MPTPKLPARELRAYQARQDLTSLQTEWPGRPTMPPAVVPRVMGMQGMGLRIDTPSKVVPAAHIEAIKARKLEQTKFAPEHERIYLADPLPHFSTTPPSPVGRLQLFVDSFAAFRPVAGASVVVTPRSSSSGSRCASRCGSSASASAPSSPVASESESPPTLLCLPRHVGEDVARDIEAQLGAIAAGQKREMEAEAQRAAATVKQEDADASGKRKKGASSASGSGAAASSSTSKKVRKHSGAGADTDSDEECEEGPISQAAAPALYAPTAPSALAQSLAGVAFESVKLDAHRQRRRVKIPLRSLAMLQEWFREHVHKPYPSDAEKRMLMQQANLDEKQITNWFTNTRKRFWYQHPTDPRQNQLLSERVEKARENSKAAKATAASASRKKKSGADSEGSMEEE